MLEISIIETPGSKTIPHLFILSCDTCRAGTISFEAPMTASSCQKCDSEFYECLGGTTLVVKPGYWRYNENTTIVLKCPANEQSCGYYFSS